MFTSCLRLLVLLAALSTHLASAQARPLRVAVVDFDGNRTRSDAARTIVIGIVGDRDDVVSKRTWTRAFSRAPGHGRQRWQRASEETGVDAVIEGVLLEEGRHYVLTLVVRWAATGEQVDVATINVAPDGMTEEAEHDLQRDLERILDWIYDHS